MQQTAARESGGPRDRRARIFDGMVWVGFAINMVVVALIVGHWLLQN